MHRSFEKWIIGFLGQKRHSTQRLKRGDDRRAEAGHSRQIDWEHAVEERTAEQTPGTVIIKKRNLIKIRGPK